MSKLGFELPIIDHMEHTVAKYSVNVMLYKGRSVSVKDDMEPSNYDLFQGESCKNEVSMPCEKSQMQIL